MVAATAVKRAEGYVRVSTKGQADGYSPEVQESYIKSYCEKEGYNLLDVRQDAETGHSLTREGYNSILDDVRAGVVDVIVVHAFDRWGRDGAEWLTRARELDRLGVKIESVTEGKDEAGLLRFVRAGMAEEESKKIARRMLRPRENAAREGTHCGPTPYGYKRLYPLQAAHGRLPVAELVPDEEVAPTVRGIFQHYAASPGMTMRQLALWANAEPGMCPPKRGAAWSTKTIENLLTNPVYVGKVGFNRHQTGKFERALPGSYFVADGRHKPLITPKLWDAVQEKLNAVRQPGVRRSRNGPMPFASGILMCQGCGGRMTRTHTGSKVGQQAGYLCSNYKFGKKDCDGGYIVQAVAHAAILEQVKRLQWHPWKQAVGIGLIPEGKDAEKKAALLKKLISLRETFDNLKRLDEVLGLDAPEEQDKAREMSRLVYDQIRNVEQQVNVLGGEKGVNLERMKKLHQSLRTLDADLRRAEAAGDDAIRKLLEPLVASACIVDRVPEKRTTWARAEVQWTEDVKMMLEAGALSLDMVCFGVYQGGQEALLKRAREADLNR